MKLIRRAAGIAAVTFSAAVLAATTPGWAIEANHAPISSINPLGTQNVPTMAEAIADLTQADPAEEAVELLPPTIQPLPVPQPEAVEPEPAPARYASLASAVAAQDGVQDMDEELACLAIGIFYEAKGEPLEGQLAVAEVILNRTESGRFPKSVCSVLKQRGQFSFVRGGVLPRPSEAHRLWKTAVAVARVAREDRWESPVPKALFFHARHVAPRWRMARVGAVGNHVFYR